MRIRNGTRVQTCALPIWLSGATTWSYYSLTQHILGIRPVYEGLCIDPCIPSCWEGFTAERRFRNKNISITVKNPNHVCKGVKELILNGKKVEGNILLADNLEKENVVEAVMG